jgi:hypothetical protein
MVFQHQEETDCPTAQGNATYEHVRSLWSFSAGTPRSSASAKERLLWVMA